MKVSDAMARNVRVARPDQPIREAAEIMARIDAGSLPVGEDDRLVGMLTDRDIVIRAVALGKGPDTPVGQVMSREVRYCFEDDEVAQVARNMGEEQIRRVPVVSREKRLVGILSLGDLAGGEDARLAGETLAEISRPGEACPRKRQTQV